MEENKKEIVAKLYSIRAGMSVLSEIYDEATEIKNDIQSSKNQINNLKNMQYNAKKDEKEKRAEFLSKMKNTDQQETLKKELQTVQSTYNKLNNFKEITRTVATIVLIITAILTYFCWETNLDSVFIILDIMLVPICLWLIIAPPPGNGSHYDKDMYLSSKRMIQEINSELYRISNNYDNMSIMKDAQFKIYSDNCEKIVLDLQNEIKKIEKEIYTKTIRLDPIYQRFKASYTAIQEQFSDVLAECDWGNLDFIIFNYETGRALDLRDALIQVDNERRNERLIHSIHTASSAICAAITRGFGDLQATIDNQFNRLNTRIASLSEQISESNSRQSQVIGDLNTNLASIADTNKAQQALLAKMSISSDILASDIENMRQLAEETYCVS